MIHRGVFTLTSACLGSLLSFHLLILVYGAVTFAGLCKHTLKSLNVLSVWSSLSTGLSNMSPGLGHVVKL